MVSFKRYGRVTLSKLGIRYGFLSRLKTIELVVSVNPRFSFMCCIFVISYGICDTISSHFLCLDVSNGCLGFEMLLEVLFALITVHRLDNTTYWISYGP